MKRFPARKHASLSVKVLVEKSKGVEISTLNKTIFSRERISFGKHSSLFVKCFSNKSKMIDTLTWECVNGLTHKRLPPINTLAYLLRA